VILLIAIAVLVLALIAFLIIRRQRYVRDAETRLDLRISRISSFPPTGRAAASSSRSSTSIRASSYTLPTLHMRAQRCQLACSTYRQLRPAGHRVDLSVDGQQLVAVGAPKDPDQLQTYIEGLAGIAQALAPSRLASYVAPALPPGFGFYGHPDWQLIGRDDTLIAKYGLTTAGFGHTTEKVIRGSNDGLPLEAFIHSWKTQRTETFTDSEGRTRTRTVTDNGVLDGDAAAGLPDRRQRDALLGRQARQAAGRLLCGLRT
jgi:hypothetical protein